MPEELKAAVLAAFIKQCEEAMAATQVEKANLAAAMDTRSKVFKAMNECVKRVRSGVKGEFGDDSLEFERMGRQARLRAQEVGEEGQACGCLEVSSICLGG